MQEGLFLPEQLSPRSLPRTVFLSLPAEYGGPYGGLPMVRRLPFYNPLWAVLKKIFPRRPALSPFPLFFPSGTFSDAGTFPLWKISFFPPNFGKFSLGKMDYPFPSPWFLSPPELPAGFSPVILSTRSKPFPGVSLCRDHSLLRRASFTQGFPIKR